MIDAVRWATVALSALTVVVGTPQWSRWLREYPPEVVQGRLALAALVLAVGYGTTEALLRGLPGGPRNLVVAVGMLWAAYTVAWHPVTALYRKLTRRTHAAP